MFAAQAGVAIEDARLRDELQQQLEELRRAADARSAMSEISGHPDDLARLSD